MRRILCFLVVVLSTSAAFADEQWVEVKSPHFQLITDGGERRGREVLQRFEEMRAGFGVLFNKLNVNISVPLTIVAFRNNKEIKRYGPMFNGKPVEDAGFFQMGEDRNFIAIDLSAPQENWGVVFHEYAHLLINSNLSQLPPWFDEGYAEYCSSLTVEGKFLKLGLPVTSDVEQLRDNRWITVTDLFSLKHESRDYNEGDRRSVFYAESWLLVHYLISTKQIPKTAVYLMLTEQQHMPVADSIQKAFGTDGNALLKELQKYFQGSVHYFQAPAPAGIDHIEVEARPLPPLEAQATLADLHYHEHDHQEEGIAEFEQIVKQEPDNALANRELGYAYLRKIDYPRAAEFFQHAAQKGSNDARVHYYTALLLARQSSATEHVTQGQFILHGGDPDQLKQIVSESKRAVELDPGYSDAWGLLGYAQSAQGSIADAIASTKRAIDLAPRNNSYRMNLASMLLQDKRYDEASQLLSTLQAAENPVMAAQAQQMQEFIEKARDYEKQRAAIQAENARLQTASAGGKAADTDSHAEPQVAAIPVANARAGFAKGKIVKIECSGDSADLTLQSGSKQMHLHVPNTKSVALIGADKFSCGWRNQPVAINYSILGENEFSVISIELP